MQNWDIALERYKSDILEGLKTLINIPSVYDENSVSETSPYGQPIAQAFNWLIEHAENDTFLVNKLNKHIGYIEYGEGPHYITALAHLDVVPATGDWVSPPYEAEVRDNLLYGRGAIDNKGPAIAIYYALKLIRQLQLPLKHRIRLIYGLNEETGMCCMDEYNKLEPQPLCGFSPDADFLIINEEKGQINGDLSYTNWVEEVEKASDLLYFHSGTLGNMVPDVATSRIRVDKPLQTQITAKIKHYCELHNWDYTLETDNNLMTLTMYGISTHGMHPYKGSNASFKLAFILIKLNLKLHGSAHHFLTLFERYIMDDYFGHRFGIATTDPLPNGLTFNAGVITYDFHNKVAFYKLNIRFPKDVTQQHIMTAINTHSAPLYFSMSDYSYKPPHFVSPEHPMIKVLQRVYTYYTKQPATLLSTGGGTYACKIKNGVAFGPLFPHRTSTAHQIDEHIPLEDLWNMIQIYAQSLYQLANIDEAEVNNYV